jgi:hypothetical protein
MILAYSAMNIAGRIIDSDKDQILSQIKDGTKVISLRICVSRQVISNFSPAYSKKELVQGAILLQFELCFGCLNLIGPTFSLHKQSQY